MGDVADLLKQLEEMAAQQQKLNAQAREAGDGSPMLGELGQEQAMLGQQLQKMMDGGGGQLADKLGGVGRDIDQLAGDLRGQHLGPDTAPASATFCARCSTPQRAMYTRDREKPAAPRRAAETLQAGAQPAGAARERAAEAEAPEGRGDRKLRRAKRKNTGRSGGVRAAGRGHGGAVSQGQTVGRSYGSDCQPVRVRPPVSSFGLGGQAVILPAPTPIQLALLGRAVGTLVCVAPAFGRQVILRSREVCNLRPHRKPLTSPAPASAPSLHTSPRIPPPFPCRDGRPPGMSAAAPRRGS